MAGIAPVLVQGPSLISVHSKIESINSVSPFSFQADDEIPIIDYSRLISADPDQRSQAIQHLGKACLHYGCFTVINHGVPESLIKGVLDGCFDFFALAEEKKREYEPKGPTDKIRWGKGSKLEDHREFLKLIPHPDFHCPTNPASLSEVLQEYCKRTRETAMELLRGISKSLGLEEWYIEKAMKLESGFDICAANAYPPNAQSTNPFGVPAHSDPSLLILLVQNVDGGFQLQRNGKWINANIAPNSIVANIGDHLEILTNGKYKSAIHRVIANNKARRVAMPIAFGPSLDSFVCPAPEFIDECHPPAYSGQTYEEYWEANHYKLIEGKVWFNTGSALNVDK